LPALIFQLLLYRLKGGILVHVHSGNWRLRAVATLLAWIAGLKCVVTIHSFRPLNNPRTQKLVSWTMKRSNRLVVTNNEIKGRCIQFGAEASIIRVQHAYLDPPIEEIPEVFTVLARKHSSLIAANAFRLRMHAGEDLYGLDLLIEVMSRLKDEFPGLGLVFLLPETGLPEYLSLCKDRITKAGIEDRFHIIQQALPFSSLLRVSQIMIRPTNTDGDSLSLREALSLGLHVIASDVVPRPSGSRLFRNRDYHDLERVLRKTLTCPLPEPGKAQDGLEGVLASYSEALND
jgi:glycosyltransferase involved in cell wall biosynthesis